MRCVQREAFSQIYALSSGRNISNLTKGIKGKDLHQGGFYEVFFRLVRKLVGSIVGEATLHEYDLLTFVTEIEQILNDRPITTLPSSPDDLSAITPSMIISGSIGDSIPPDVFMRSDGYRGSWRKTQILIRQVVGKLDIPMPSYASTKKKMV